MPIRRVTTFKSSDGKETTIHVDFIEGEWLRAIGTDGLSLKDSAIKEIEKLLRAGHTIEHTGAIEVEGSKEFMDWSPDYEVAEEFEDGSVIYKYAQWSTDGSKVRGTLERVLLINGIKTVLSSKKTYRID